MIRQNTKLLFQKISNKGILEKLLLSRRRNLSQLQLEQTENEYPSECFWERQWIIFDGDFDTDFLDQSLQIINDVNPHFINSQV